MKKRSLLVIGISLLLTSCNLPFTPNNNSSIITPSSSEISSNNTSTSSEEISSSSSIESSNSSSEESSSEIIELPSINSDISDNELTTFTINSTNYGKVGSYATNYDEKTINGYTFGQYRVSKGSGTSFVSLIPYTSYVDDGSQEGALYNISPIYGIRYITLTYKTQSSSGTPKIFYGDDFSRDFSIDIEASTTEVTKTYTLPDINFFKIDTNDNSLYISSIEIKYTNETEEYDRRYDGSGTNDYRLNPVTVNESLVPGETKVTVPTKVEYTSTGYNVLETKEYTYYTYEYINSNPSFADEAALTDPADIAAYYNSFRTHPANYVVKKNYTTAKKLFGNDTRCISTYSRTSGYATCVPWQKQPTSNSPLYHELDIDTESNYSSGNRGSGRLVVWYYGFTSEGYDDSPVSVFTNDHYATFQEYYNDGTFGNKFNAEMTVTNYTFSPAITKN